MRTIHILSALSVSLFCVACTAERNGGTRQEHVDYDSAVLTVDWGLYARSKKAVTILDPVVIAQLDAEFSRIKMNSKGRPRVDWKAQGTLAFRRDGEVQRKVILGITEWTEGGENNIEYPLSKDLQSRLKQLASEKTPSTDK